MVAYATKEANAFRDARDARRACRPEREELTAPRQPKRNVSRQYLMNQELKLGEARFKSDEARFANARKFCD